MEHTIDGRQVMIVRDGPLFVGWIESLGVSRESDCYEELWDELTAAIRSSEPRAHRYATVAARLGAVPA